MLWQEVLYPTFTRYLPNSYISWVPILLYSARESNSWIRDRKRASQLGIMKVAIIADDLTGAADTGVQFAAAGYRMAVAFRGAPIPPTEDLDAVALDTDSRAMPAGFPAKGGLGAGGGGRAG